MDDISVKHCIQNGVLIGSRGELYLAHGAHRPLDYLDGSKPPPEEAFARFRRNLHNRQTFCKKIGVEKYIHVMAPDKHAVMTDDFPLKGRTSLGQQVGSHPALLYPVQALQTVQPRPYHMTDTHWTIRGCAKAIEETLNHLGITGGLSCALDDLVVPETPLLGDLGLKLGNIAPEESEQIRPKHEIRVAKSASSRGNMGRIIGVRSRHPDARGRAMIFCDSFFLGRYQLFTYIFEETILCRSPYLHKELVLQSRPDVVITQSAERYLASPISDKDAPPFFLLAALHGHEQGCSPANAELLASLLMPRR